MNWFKVESVQCDSNLIETKVSDLGAKYKTNIILLKQQPLPNQTYFIEVWFNFQSQMYLINIYTHYNNVQEGVMYE